MKKIFIFFILFFIINSFSIYNTRNIISGITGINFDEKCITEKIDQILNELYYNCANYYYEFDSIMKTRYLVHVLINIAEIRAEISNCKYEYIENIIFYLSIYLKALVEKKMDDDFYKNNWTKISKFTNDLFEIYHSKNFNYTEFGKGLNQFIFNLLSTN